MTYLMVPVGEGQGLVLIFCGSGMLIRRGGIGLRRFGGLGICCGVFSASTSAWNTILMLVLGNRSTHLQVDDRYTVFHGR